MHAPEVSGLDLAGLEGVRAELEEWLAVVRAERARIVAGAQARRRAWKNAIFTGPPGAGKSRAAAALARAHQELGALPFAGVYETLPRGWQVPRHGRPPAWSTTQRSEAPAVSC